MHSYIKTAIHASCYNDIRLYIEDKREDKYHEDQCAANHRSALPKSLTNHLILLGYGG